MADKTMVMVGKETVVPLKHAGCGHWWRWRMPVGWSLAGYYAEILRMGMDRAGALCPKCLAVERGLEATRRVLEVLERDRRLIRQTQQRRTAARTWRRARRGGVQV